MLGIVTGCTTQADYERWLTDNGLPYRLVDEDTDLSGISAMLFCGGPDWGENPLRDRREQCVFEKCMKAGIAVWGGCRGMQVVAHLLGAGLVQDLGEKNLVHRATELGVSRWHQIVLSNGLRWQVNSRHHQAVRDIPFQCRLIGRADDGTLELLLSEDNRFLLVQSHPEREEMIGSEIEKHSIAWLNFKLNNFFPRLCRS